MRQPERNQNPRNVKKIQANEIRWNGESVAPSERVEEGDDFVASEFEVSLPHRRQIEGGGIGLIKRARKEDLERRAEALRLQFAPEFAFLAADAVHDLRHVAEVVAEFHFQLLGVTTAAEHGRLVKVRAEWSTIPINRQ